MSTQWTTGMEMRCGPQKRWPAVRIKGGGRGSVFTFYLWDSETSPTPATRRLARRAPIRYDEANAALCELVAELGRWTFRPEATDAQAD